MTPVSRCSVVIEIDFFDGVDVVVPGAATQVGASLNHGVHMQVLDGLLIGRPVPAQSEHLAYLSSPRLLRWQESCGSIMGRQGRLRLAPCQMAETAQQRERDI
jgi:hypothetical protein